MKSRFSRPRTWVALMLLAVLCLLLWGPVHQVIVVAAVQDSLQRAWEINFGDGNIPASLPTSVASVADDLFERIFEKTQGYSGAEPAPTRNRDIIYEERFRAFFRGPIRTVEIYYMEGFRGDLGAALARFPGLRRVAVDDNEETFPTEVEWKLLCTRLRAIPDLEEVELGGGQLTDASLAPLSGHPRIKKVKIGYSHLSDKSIATFASMPRLKEIYIEVMEREEMTWPDLESEKTMRTALQGVTLIVPRSKPQPEPNNDSESSKQ